MISPLFVSSFVTFFVIVDPIGTAAIFTSLTQNMTPRQALKISVKAILIALSLYAFFGFLGMKLLEHMGVSIGSFRIAGGLLLFVTAFRMIMGSHDRENLEADKNVYEDRSHIAVFPLALPLLAGPGCLTALLLLLQHAPGMNEKFSVIAALLIVQLTAFAAFMLGNQLQRAVGPAIMSIIARVMGILLASMAVQFVLDGIKMSGVAL